MRVKHLIPLVFTLFAVASVIAQRGDPGVNNIFRQMSREALEYSAGGVLDSITGTRNRDAAYFADADTTDSLYSTSFGTVSLGNRLQNVTKITVFFSAFDSMSSTTYLPVLKDTIPMSQIRVFYGVNDGVNTWWFYDSTQTLVAFTDTLAGNISELQNDTLWFELDPPAVNANMIRFQIQVSDSNYRKAYSASGFPLSGSLRARLRWGVSIARDDDPIDMSNVFLLDRQNTFTGDGIYWENIHIDAQATRLNPGLTKPDFTTFRDGINLFHFDAADTESVQFDLHLPDNYIDGTAIYPKVDWSPKNTNTGNVRWGLEYTWANDGGSFGATDTIYVLDAGGGITYDYQEVYFDTISGVGIQGSAEFLCRFFRDGAHASDTYTADAAFINFGFNVKINKVGEDGPD